ncbi:PREDICTED: ATPase family AAA domain-containing protein 1-like [Merops nubicus]|uniref:ATPase family AAA domain-containing protein 1-like n=1 Tax=Merops nubicus TaxID=57421 RepID=UPI0004F04DAD|nr:PREDICTED: ATPase family AAA domain-containing protein 1-like [Merops nubicus]
MVDPQLALRGSGVCVQGRGLQRRPPGQRGCGAWRCFGLSQPRLFPSFLCLGGQVAHSTPKPGHGVLGLGAGAQGMSQQDSNTVDRHVDLLQVAKETDGFSGSDLKEMCRDAALLCVREYVNAACGEEAHDEDEIRPVQQQDLHRAIEKMRRSKDATLQNVLMHVSLD